jgi:TolA-binding protein
MQIVYFYLLILWVVVFLPESMADNGQFRSGITSNGNTLSQDVQKIMHDQKEQRNTNNEAVEMAKIILDIRLKNMQQRINKLREIQIKLSEIEKRQIQKLQKQLEEYSDTH